MNSACVIDRAHVTGNRETDSHHEPSAKPVRPAGPEGIHGPSDRPGIGATDDRRWPTDSSRQFVWIGCVILGLAELVAFYRLAHVTSKHVESPPRLQIQAAAPRSPGPPPVVERGPEQGGTGVDAARST